MQAVPRPWRMRGLMSSLASWIDRSLERAKFDRGPWLVVAFAGGVGLWFLLGAAWQWVSVIGLACVPALAATLWAQTNFSNFAIFESEAILDAS